MGRKDEMCAWALAIANDDSHGYTQGAGRMGPTDYDCAGLAIRAAQHAGYPTGDATYTGDMIPEMGAVGWEVLPYSWGALRRGDLEIIPKTSYQHGHVAICIDDSGDKTLVEAYANEFGGATGGRPGDQTGGEIRTSSDYGFGTHILRPPADPAPEPPAPEPPKPTVVPKKGPDEEVAMPAHQGAVKRLYNPYSGDHIWTADTDEISNLIRSGWRDEGTVGTAPVGYADVYRFTNASTGEHIWTDDWAEAHSLLGVGQNLSDGTREGWQYEGVAFIAHSGDQGAVKLHRLYKLGAPHLLTADANEIKTLIAQGWTDEGVKFSLDA